MDWLFQNLCRKEPQVRIIKRFSDQSWKYYLSANCNVIVTGVKGIELQNHLTKVGRFMYLGCSSVSEKISVFYTTESSDKVRYHRE